METLSYNDISLVTIGHLNNVLGGNGSIDPIISKL